MATIKVPTLGIVGALDPVKKPMQELKAALPQMKLVLFDGSAAHRFGPSSSKRQSFLAEHPAPTDGH